MLKKNLFLAVILLGSFVYAYAWEHLANDKLQIPPTGYDVSIAPGTSLHKISNQLYEEKILTHPRLFRWYAIARGYANKIQAGEYLVPEGTTPLRLLELFVDGDVVQYSFTIVEGMRTQDVIADLLKHAKIESTLAHLTEEQIIEELNIPVMDLEGIFWPETYFFAASTKDVDFLRRAYLNMQLRLQKMWGDRAEGLQVHTPYEALVLASIIEKESGVLDEYRDISGVYHRRLAKGMRLQADPTVIYALGNKLEGKLLKRHLYYESPFNTYRNAGLPPTPIAIPSIAAIQAALNPTDGDTLYFVAKGDGSHVFSATLKEHNKAVKKFRNSKE